MFCDFCDSCPLPAVCGVFLVLDSTSNTHDMSVMPRPKITIILGPSEAALGRNYGRASFLRFVFPLHLCRTVQILTCSTRVIFQPMYVVACTKGVHLANTPYGFEKMIPH